MPRGRSQNGSGTIIFVKGRKKPYRVQYCLDGQRKNGGYYASSEEASKALRALTAAIDDGSFVEPKKMKLSAWLETWLQEYCVEVKPSTVVQYRAYVKNHINPSIGDIRLRDLQPHHVQAFVNKLERSAHGNKPLSYKTKKNIHGCLSAALECAVKMKYIKDNPATGCKIPHPAVEDVEIMEIKPLEGEQITAFLQAIRGNRFEPIFQLALFTGMRLSEILGLQWQRVDFTKNEIKISKQLSLQRKAGDTRQLAPTKTRKARTIIATQDAMDVLKEVQKKQRMARLKAGAAWGNADNLVFTDEIGNSLPHSSIEHQFKRIVTGMGLPERRFHDLRHTFATQALKAGVDFKTLQSSMGHSTLAMTMQVYAHVLDDMKKDAADRLQQAFEAHKSGVS